MPSPQPSTLDEKIASLAPEVDARFRQALPLVLRTLRVADNPKSVLEGMSPLALQMMREVFKRAGQTPPSDNLFSCTEKAKNLGLLPGTMVDYLTPLRRLSNQVHNGTEEMAFTEDHAEHALDTFLLVLQWFYCDYAHGPRLPSLYGRPTEPAVEAYARCCQDCVTRWSEARYALDTHFVHLTLLRDQGEETQGPRWQSGPERFHDLSTPPRKRGVEIVAYCRGRLLFNPFIAVRSTK